MKSKIYTEKEIQSLNKNPFVIKVIRNRFIEYAQKFYNGFYDEDAYKEVVAEPTPKPKPAATESAPSQSSTSASSNGCMVTILMAFSALSSLAVCVSLLIGLF